jgi:hypothetical protein
MKVSDIKEHKKGMKAKIYTSKPKPINPVAKHATAAIGGGAPGAHKNKAKEIPRHAKHKKELEVFEDGAITVQGTMPGPNGQEMVKLSNGSQVPQSSVTAGAQPNTIQVAPMQVKPGMQVTQTQQNTSMEEDLFGTTEQDLAKDPGPAGEYYRKLAALKTDPRWAGKQDLVQKRIEDLLNRINGDQGVPQPNAGKPMGPETDPDKFQQKNPSFGQPNMLDRMNSLAGIK